MRLSCAGVMSDVTPLPSLARRGGAVHKVLGVESTKNIYENSREDVCLHVVLLCFK